MNFIDNGRQRPPRALIVEDDMTWETIWSLVLKEINPHFEYTWATSAKEAGTYLDQSISTGEVFDVVISDIFVSGSKTGIDLYERYREALTDRLIFTSGVDMNRLKKQVNADGSKIAFLRKPFTKDQCIKTIRSVLSPQPSDLKPPAKPTIQIERPIKPINSGLVWA